MLKKKKLGKLDLRRETLQGMVAGSEASFVSDTLGPTEPVSACISDTFPGNCRTR